ncbi:MAG: SDR family oxidoreductase [Pararobbsia sp.]
MSKIAIVTGASRGIGAAIAARLARDGMTVVVNYSNHADTAEAVVAKITAAGGKAMAVQADVADTQSVRAMFDTVEARLGKIDVIVNNAGVMPPIKPLAESDDATFERVVAINLKGSFNVLREAAVRLNDGGRIVNFSSSVVGLAFVGYSIYAATKAAVETITTILAKELRGRGITVNAIAPGPTATDLFLDGKSPETLDRLAKAAPLERLGTTEDIANAVAFLVGPDGGWINAQTLRANGGII